MKYDYFLASFISASFLKSQIYYIYGLYKAHFFSLASPQLYDFESGVEAEEHARPHELLAVRLPETLAEILGELGFVFLSHPLWCIHLRPLTRRSADSNSEQARHKVQHCVRSDCVRSVTPNLAKLVKV